MKVILYIASTINGMAAQSDGNSDWVSAEDTASFNSKCREIGCVIMGRHTFDIFNDLPTNDWPNAGGVHIILTSKPHLPSSHPSILLSSSPRAALDRAESIGKTSVVVSGGSQTFGSFMKENLVDEIFLDMEPLAFGEGMPLFAAGPFEHRLELLSTKLLSPHTLHLHYQVKK